MVDLGAIGAVIPVALLSGVGGWAGNAILQWMKSSGERQQANAAAAVTLEQHTDKFALELLNAMRTELADLRPLQTRLAHLEEALDHISALLSAESAEERLAAERRARAFLNRMRGRAEARALGTPLQAAYRATATAPLPPEIADELGKID